MPIDAVTHVRDAVRTFNKYVLNPAMIHLAGRKHWYAAVIRHSGRRSGRSYATPVVADRATGVVSSPLRWGTGGDWVRAGVAGGRGQDSLPPGMTRCRRLALTLAT